MDHVLAKQTITCMLRYTDLDFLPLGNKKPSIGHKELKDQIFFIETIWILKSSRKKGNTQRDVLEATQQLARVWRDILTYV